MTQWLSLTDAAALVQDGQTIALGGMTIYRRPVAFVRELLRRDPRPKDLTLLCFTAGYRIRFAGRGGLRQDGALGLFRAGIVRLRADVHRESQSRRD